MSDDDAAALDALADEAHLAGDFERAIALKERAYAAYRHEGKPLEASEAAQWLTFLYGTVHGNMAAASGWLGRAASVLEGVPECPAHGWLTLFNAPFSEDRGEREKLALAALAIARRFGDADLEADSLALLGETYVATGRVAEGMRLLDQAMAAVAAGEVGRFGSVEEIFCRLLSACEHAVDVRRAEEWMAAIDRYVTWTQFVRPTCRTHYGGILVALGRWTEAESELLDALRTFEGGYRAERVYPLVRLADLRVRQGRYEEAERLLEGLEWHPIARRAAATIALARGDAELAAGLARLCVEPSDPVCAPVLELLVRIELARGDEPAARAACEQLSALAASSRSRRVQAFAALAAGRVEGSPARLKQAIEAFAGLQLPLEAARAQLALAGTMTGEAAVAEARLALAQFERLGATRDADEATRLLRDRGASGRGWPRSYGTLTKREQEVLALLAGGFSNAEIAQRLVISRRTAEHHVASILSKLGLRSRAEAAAYAVREPPERPVAR